MAEVNICSAQFKSLYLYRYLRSICAPSQDDKPFATWFRTKSPRRLLSHVVMAIDKESFQKGQAGVAKQPHTNAGARSRAL